MCVQCRRWKFPVNNIGQLEDLKINNNNGFNTGFASAGLKKIIKREITFN